MEIQFNKTEILIDNNLFVSYDLLEKENGYLKLYELLEKCMDNSEELKFTSTEDCTPFGVILKETIASKFSR